MPNIRQSSRLLCAALLVFASYTPSAHALLLSLQPGTTAAGIGDRVDLDLVVGDLGNFSAPTLGVFDVTVSYDNSALVFIDYLLGDLLGELSLLEAIDASAGDSGNAVNIAEVSLLSAAELDALQPDSFVLATLTFDVIELAAGAATELSIRAGAIVGDTSGEALPITATSSATIQNGGSVPLVSSPLLVALALICALLVRQHVAQRTTPALRYLHAQQRSE